jgi:6-pyruvoyl-tetrahydropterin synthase
MFINHLTALDCAIYDLTCGLYGMSWHVNVEFLGELDHEGVVFDFSKAKKLAKTVIDQKFDHRVIQQRQYTPYTSPHKDCVCNIDQVDQGSLEIAIARTILSECHANNLKNIIQVIVHLETDNQYDTYFHYLHALPQHDGNCQRLHGHRSAIRVWADDEPNKDLEKIIKNKYDYKYISQTGDCFSQWSGTQGDFSLSIPTSHITEINIPTTIENICIHASNLLYNLKMNKQIYFHKLRICMFEGVNKGATYTLNTFNSMEIIPKLLKG